ncbi:MAG TPA: S4 domain-containing protein, partial [Acidimicrobiia bacterium]|nr:S4 domain-containing protein [Acidimicrobiia bacterium]
MSAVEEFDVPETLAGERVDRAVAMLTGWSRSDVQAVMADGGVLVDGVPVAKSRRLEAGEVVTVQGEPKPPEPPGPDPSVPFEVRYADEWLAVVAKPAGVVVHPGAGSET